VDIVLSKINRFIENKSNAPLIIVILENYILKLFRSTYIEIDAGI
jgi:hypothetical protein